MTDPPRSLTWPWLPPRGARGSPRRLRCLAWLSLLLCGACVPSPGPFVLEAAEGRVLDADSGRPIAGAEVIEGYRGAGGGDVAAHYHARWVTTDERGRFALPRELSPSLRMWLLRTYGPDYSFYHPSYGLEHGARTAADGSLELRGSTRQAEQRHQNLWPICRGERDDPGARHLARIACPAGGSADR